MTIALFVLGAGLAAAGTRAASAAFVAIAVLGAASDVLPAVITWTAVLIAGLCWTGGLPRRLAIPALGAAAVLAAGAAHNGAVVFGLWALGTAVAASRVTAEESERRWALSLVACDVPVAAAVAWTVIRGGFEAWPPRSDTVGICLLLAAGLLRAPLSSGPSEDQSETSFIIVRTQTAVALLIALNAAGAQRGVLIGAALVGAAGFAVGGSFRRAATRDVVQELTLLTVVVAAARLGWGARGWEWGALAAGTLIHSLRLRADARQGWPLSATLLAGGSIGLPLLPVVLVALEGATEASPLVGVLMAFGLIGGLATRAMSASDPTAPPEGRPAGTRREWIRAGGLASAAVAVALWAPLVTLQPAPDADPVRWPPIWAGGLVAAAGLGAARWGKLEPKPAPRSPAPWRPDELRLPPRWAAPRIVRASTIGLGVVSGLFWVIGILRGFL